MRILVTGAGGLLGGRLATLLARDHETTALIRRQPAPGGIPNEFADLADEASTTAAWRRARPQVVVHCAGLADVEACERDPQRARRANEMVTQTVARVCQREGARLIAISSDLVFTGDTAFLTETDRATPATEYGRSKLLAEAAALREDPECVILRVALICGQGHGAKLTASESVAQRLQRGESVILFEDEWRTPIGPASVSDAVKAVLLRPSVKGLFHIGGSERLSRVELGDRVAKLLKLEGASIVRTLRSSYQGAPRAKDVSLCITRAKRELGWTPQPLDATLLEGRAL